MKSALGLPTSFRQDRQTDSQLAVRSIGQLPHCDAFAFCLCSIECSHHFLFVFFLGNYAPIIVPPSWIVKLPNKGNFKSSIRVSNKNIAAGGATSSTGAPGGGGKSKKQTQKRQKVKEEKKEPRAFIVKPIPSPEVIPVIVFINPKSGGNQGVKLLGKFQHLLNPRQVFDLTQGGPKMG